MADVKAGTAPKAGGALKPNGAKTKKSPITKEQFLEQAKPIVMKIGDIPLAAKPMEFKSGSFGWNCTGKHTIEVNGVAVEVQVGCNLTVIGSKPE